jgi:hypothetical protein
MAGLVPAIHPLTVHAQMVGTRPAMTRVAVALPLFQE